MTVIDSLEHLYKCTRGVYINEEDGSKQKFTYTFTLVFIQCIINSSFAFVVRWFSAEQGAIDTTSHYLYSLCAFAYLGAMVASNKALQWVSYPTQVLGKSAKPIPVMVMGVLFAHKRYPTAKYFCVLLISLGVAMFIYKDSKKPDKGLDTDHTFGAGEILLIVSLMMDGATGVVQSKMKARHSTKSYDMMLNMNLWSLAWLAVPLMLGEAYEFFYFAQKFPQVFPSIVMFGITSACGQHFVFLMVTTFGPLACSIATTTRKFFTILASVLFFGHSLLFRQWVGTACVFLGLGLDTAYGKELQPAAPGNGHIKPHKRRAARH